MKPTSKEQKVIPSLRFQEFREDWCTKRIDEVFHIGAGGDIDKSRLSKAESDDFPYPIFANAETRKGLYGYASYFKEEGECITVSGRGNLGTPHARHEAFVPIVRLLVLRPLAEADVDFFEKVLRITRFFIESTGVPQLTGPQIGGYRIGFPTFPEQRKIADFLTAVDGRIGQLIQKKALLEDYKKGVMQQLFTQAIRFKDDHGNDFPDWEERKLGDVADVRDGTHESPKYHTAGFPLVTSKNLQKDGSIDMSNVDLISEKDYRAINKRSNVESGDIVFGMIGTIGNPVIVADAGFAIKNVALIKEKNQLLNRYLIHQLASANIARQFYRENTGGTQKFIALGVIRKLLIQTPSIPEQTKFAAFLSAIDRKIESVATQITETQTFKRGLLQQMFV